MSRYERCRGGSVQMDVSGDKVVQMGARYTLMLSYTPSQVTSWMHVLIVVLRASVIYTPRRTSRHNSSPASQCDTATVGQSIHGLLTKPFSEGHPWLAHGSETCASQSHLVLTSAMEMLCLRMNALTRGRSSKSEVTEPHVAGMLNVV